MTTGPTNAFDLAQTLKTAIETAFTTDGVSLPTTRYITTGTPVGLCDSLAISWGGIFYGVPGNGSGSKSITASSAVVRSIIFTISVFRCVATVDSSGNTSPAAMTSDAQTILTDAYVLHRALSALRSNGNLRGTCEGLAIGQIIPIEPDGGIAGVQCELEAELS